MDHPIFKLEKVVQPKIGETLEDFEGPLDLILFLLNKNKIEIQDIPIALILDQYLAYLEQRKQMDLEVASEFVTMAAHLMYIKTRMLLSIEDEEAQSEMDALIQSLAERQRGDAYARIRKLTERMGPMSEFGPQHPDSWAGAHEAGQGIRVRSGAGGSGHYYAGSAGPPGSGGDTAAAGL